VFMRLLLEIDVAMSMPKLKIRGRAWWAPRFGSRGEPIIWILLALYNSLAAEIESWLNFTVQPRIAE